MRFRPAHLLGSALTALLDEAADFFRRDATVLPSAALAGAEVAEVDVPELERLRATARHAGALTKHDAGWFAAVLRERLARAPGGRARNGIDSGVPAGTRAERRIASACKRAAASAGVASVGGHAGELVTAMSDGLAWAVFIPAVIAAVATETVFTTMLQVDLACDLASIYGVPFAVGDVGELATVFEVALGGAPEASPRHRADARRLLADNDAELLARVGRTLAADALLGLVPLVGIPASIAKNYRDTMRIGRSAQRYVAGRRAVHELLGGALPASDLDKTLLLEGAWLLSTCDDFASHEELLLLSALVHAIPAPDRPPVERLGFVGEGVWVVRMALLPEDERRLVFDALHTVAGLRGPMERTEREFLARVAAALEQTVDHARIAEVRARATALQT
jgi:hypothetical protein